jgi:hypothetical protein
MILRVKAHKTCRNGGKTRKSLKSHKTCSKSHKHVENRKNVKNGTFSRLSLNVTGPNAKLEMHKFCLRPCLSQSLFFPNSHPTRRPPSPNSSLSHTPTPDFVQSSPPLPVSHSSSLPDSLPLSPFPSKFINHFPPDPERYWREEGNN